MTHQLLKLWIYQIIFKSLDSIVQQVEVRLIKPKISREFSKFMKSSAYICNLGGQWVIYWIKAFGVDYPKLLSLYQIWLNQAEAALFLCNHTRTTSQLAAFSS